MSSSPCSVMEEEHDQFPPTLPRFVGGGIHAADLASRSPLKNPPRLEPQVEPQVKLKQKEVIILESDDNGDEDDRSTIVFSDGEDPDDDEPLPSPALVELP